LDGYGIDVDIAASIGVGGGLSSAIEKKLQRNNPITIAV